MKILEQLTRWGPFQMRGKRHVADSLAVLPVLRAQLEEVSRLVESSVVKVCGNFSAIAARSRKAMGKTAELLEGSQQERNAGVEQSIETSRVTIGALLERLERSATVSSQAVARMEEVGKVIEGIRVLLGDLQRIAFSNKLVALNAKIEAVHVGHLGSGFEVVADEIARQGDRSNELAEQIGVRVQDMVGSVNRAADDLRVLVAENRETLAQSRRDAEGALDLLLEVHQRARDSMNMMAAENGRLAGEISEAVVGLQFQDRTTQCLAHVAEALERMEKNLGPSALSTSSATPGAGSLLEEVRKGYSMESERAVMTRALQAQPEGAAGGEVELF